MTLEVKRLTGAAIAPVLPEVARLRIAVFREWPYLYDGSLAYEQDYLADFAACHDAVVVAAIDDGRIVGAATASPLEGHSAEFVPLFEAHGIDPDTVLYCGESVLMPEYRGRGIGGAFFDHREGHARACHGGTGAYTRAAFCGVVREADDPRKPAGYSPLDPFWTNRGYAKVPGLVGTYRWKEIGATEETDHPMQFWMRVL